MSPVIPALVYIGIVTPLSTWLTLKAGKKYGVTPTVVGSTAITAGVALLVYSLSDTSRLTTGGVSRPIGTPEKEPAT